MIETFEDIDGALCANTHRSDADHIQIRLPYRVSRPALGSFRATLAAAEQSLAIDVNVQADGGVLVQSGSIVLSGNWGALRWLLATIRTTGAMT